MKILAINGSPHKNGNTVRLINQIFQGARKHNHQCEIVHLIDLHLDYCNWCSECYSTGVCPIEDGFPEHLEQLFESDMLIVATPSFNRSVTGYMKNWLDRFCTSMLIYEVDDNRKVIMRTRVSRGKRAIVIVQGCTNLFQETIEPINIVLKVLFRLLNDWLSPMLDLLKTIQLIKK
jgi:multimeric flavodoxin WrbA